MLDKFRNRLFVLSLCCVLLTAVTATAAFTFVVQITGTADTGERDAAVMMIKQENTRRAALTPPQAALPFSTAAERKTSYEAALTQVLTSAHGSYVEQAKTLNHEQRRKAYNAADQSVRDQVDTLLSPYVPGSFVLPSEWQRFRAPDVVKASLAIAA